MKNIQIAKVDKYNKYKEIDDDIFEKDGNFYISLSFEQEPQLDEGEFADNISQYPLEDILDKYKVVVSDFYKKLNKKKSKICYLEFSSNTLSSIKKMKGLVGKHIYNKKKEEKGQKCVELVIE